MVTHHHHPRKCVEILHLVLYFFSKYFFMMTTIIDGVLCLPTFFSLFLLNGRHTEAASQIICLLKCSVRSFWQQLNGVSDSLIFSPRLGLLWNNTPGQSAKFEAIVDSRCLFHFPIPDWFLKSLAFWRLRSLRISLYVTSEETGPRACTPTAEIQDIHCAWYPRGLKSCLEAVAVCCPNRILRS